MGKIKAVMTMTTTMITTMMTTTMTTTTGATEVTGAVTPTRMTSARSWHGAHGWSNSCGRRCGPGLGFIRGPVVHAAEGRSAPVRTWGPRPARATHLRPAPAAITRGKTALGATAGLSRSAPDY